MYRSAPSPSPLILISTRNGIVARERRTGVPVWESTGGLGADYESRLLGFTITGSSVVLVFVASKVKRSWKEATSASHLYITCLGYRDGKAVWQKDLGECNPVGFHAAVAVDDGQILVAHLAWATALSLEDGAWHWTHRHEPGICDVKLPDTNLHVKSD